MIPGWSQKNYDAEFRRELLETIRDELVHEPRSTFGWFYGPLKFLKRQFNFDYDLLLSSSCVLFFLLPVLFALFVAWGDHHSERATPTIAEIRLAAEFGFPFFLGLITLPSLFCPLGKSRGIRNAIYPLKDDSLARWLLWHTCLLGLATFMASLYFFAIYVADAVSLTISGSILLSAFNALFLSLLTICVIRLLPPNFENGAILTGPILLFGCIGLHAVAGAGIEKGGIFEFFGLAAAPCTWVANLYFVAVVNNNPFGWLLLVPIAATISVGLVCLKAMTRMSQQENYFEFRVRSQSITTERRRRFEKWAGARTSKSADTTIACQEEFIESRIKWHSQFPASNPQFKYKLVDYPNSKKPITCSLTLRQLGLVKSVIVIACLIIVLLAFQSKQHLPHSVLGLVEGILLGSCLIEWAVSFTNGACTRRYPFSYWQTILSSLKSSFLNLLLVLPFYIAYLFMLDHVDPMSIRDLCEHLGATSAAILFVAGFLFPIGFSIETKTIRLAITWLYCLAGTALVLSPFSLKLHFYIAKLKTETPPELFSNNLGMFATLAHPNFIGITVVSIAAAGIAHFAFYSFFYQYWQRDVHGTPICFSSPTNCR